MTIFLKHMYKYCVNDKLIYKMFESIYLFSKSQCKSVRLLAFYLNFILENNKLSNLDIKNIPFKSIKDIKDLEEKYKNPRKGYDFKINKDFYYMSSLKIQTLYWVCINCSVLMAFLFNEVSKEGEIFLWNKIKKNIFKNFKTTPHIFMNLVHSTFIDTILIYRKISKDVSKQNINRFIKKVRKYSTELIGEIYENKLSLLIHPFTDFEKDLGIKSDMPWSSINPIGLKDLLIIYDVDYMKELKKIGKKEKINQLKSFQNLLYYIINYDLKKDTMNNANNLLVFVADTNGLLVNITKKNDYVIKMIIEIFAYTYIKVKKIENSSLCLSEDLKKFSFVNCLLRQSKEDAMTKYDYYILYALRDCMIKNNINVISNPDLINKYLKYGYEKYSKKGNTEIRTHLYEAQLSICMIHDFMNLRYVTSDLFVLKDKYKDNFIKGIFNGLKIITYEQWCNYDFIILNFMFYIILKGFKLYNIIEGKKIINKYFVKLLIQHETVRIKYNLKKNCLSNTDLFYNILKFNDAHIEAEKITDNFYEKYISKAYFEDTKVPQDKKIREVINIKNSSDSLKIQFEKIKTNVNNLLFKYKNWIDIQNSSIPYVISKFKTDEWNTFKIIEEDKYDKQNFLDLILSDNPKNRPLHLKKFKRCISYNEFKKGKYITDFMKKCPLLISYYKPVLSEVIKKDKYKINDEIYKDLLKKLHKKDIKKSLKRTKCDKKEETVFKSNKKIKKATYDYSSDSDKDDSNDSDYCDKPKRKISKKS